MTSAERTRRRILDAAWRLLSAAPATMRMEDVARAADISRQALYLHFPDRASLVVATAAHGDEILGLEAATRPLREATSAIEMLERLPEFYGEYLGRVYDISVAMEALRHADPAVDAALKDRARARLAGAQQVVARLEAEGLLAHDLLREDAAALVAALGSIHLWGELTRELGWSRERYVDHLRRLLRRALLAT